ncbi:uncharacterized protein LOC131628172 [Vicia villosa]|uniref:uncharacterized protein LOC131628172 n=1 Tax=Vicia villosa TaxID=3911 RepID=UPI00273AADE0|nr:uncharacterized protein LOC131628172 [Vicia villosa]
MATNPPNSSTQPSSSDVPSVASSAAAKIHQPVGDIGWKFNHLKDLNNRRRVTCNFCNETSTGGISRAKQHQLGIKGNVKACTQTPEDVKLILQEHEDKKLAAKKSISGEVHEDDDEASRLLEISRIRSGKRPAEEGSMPTAKKNTKGPLDVIYYRKPEENLKKGKQTSLNDACDKKARASCCQYIARFFYRNGIAFNVAKSKSFKLMVEAIGMYGAHLKPPSYHELRVPLLQDELRLTHEMLSTNKKEQEKYGCSIMSDGWTDTKGRTLINFLVNSPAGTMFVKSVDASADMKTGQKLFQLLDSFVEEIGESNVVQLVTDNGSNYVLAGRHLQVSRPKIFWTPCAAHCLDLMLEDIGKIPKVKKVIQKGMTLVGFIYNHSLVLNLMREKLESELVRSGVTRFATNFLTLHRLHILKAKIRTMFTSEEWLNLNASKEVKGKKAAAIVLQVSFWEDIVYTLKAMGPLVKVLRLVDNEKRPAMGSIYHAMLEAKEFIQRNFNNNENKYKDIIDIVDRRWSIQLHHPLHAAGYYLNPKYFYTNPMIENDATLLDGLYACINKLSANAKVVDAIHGDLAKYKMGVDHFGLTEAVRQRDTISPAEWWKRYGAKTPDLQLLAIKILSLTCSSSGCERNWSAFEHIHSKKRNRLEHQMLQDLVFIKYNQTLKERFDSDDMIDPVVMEDDIDTTNLWLLGGEDEVQPDDDMVFDGDDLSWLDVEIASGAVEPIINTRSQAALQKKATTAAPSSSRSKGKAKEVVVVDDEFGDQDYLGEGEEDEEDEENEEDGGSDDEDMEFNDS